MCKADFERSKTIFRKTSAPTLVQNVIVNQPTEVEGLITDASVLAGSALSLFVDLADDLGEAARRFETTALIAQEQIDTLVEQMQFALDQADANYTAARKLRELVGIDSNTLEEINP